jgi:hypothetical protein
MSLRRLVDLCSALLLVAAVPAYAQDATGAVTHTIAAGVHYQGFDFGASGDIRTAKLLLVPITFQSRLNSRTAFDGYAAYASGEITGAGKRYTLDGPVDSWVRLRWAANSWAVVAVGVAVPTGVSSHTGEEAAVSNALANDLLGFREATWGGAASGTFGISTARRIGANRLTFGTSYRVAGSFQPSVDTAMRYAPGDEARVRLGVERKIGTGNLHTGLTMQHFTIDKADQRNLFQSGNRIRGDIAYSTDSWGIYAANLLRARGDLLVPIVNALDGTALRDTVINVGWQNLTIVGLHGSIRVGNSMVIAPSADFKARRREDAGGNGWLGTVGLVLPLRLGAAELFPSVKATYGSIISSVNTGFGQKVKGLEAGMVIRRAFIKR